MKPFLLALAALCLAACDANTYWDNDGHDYVIPPALVGIEAANVDNAGEWSALSTAAIKKEALMIGIRWQREQVPGGEYVTPANSGRHWLWPVEYDVKIFCLEPFNDRVPAESNVSDFFKEADFLPEGIDQGLVLLVAPKAGQHSFRVEYWRDNELAFSSKTQPVELL